jgi:hypothetical protein
MGVVVEVEGTDTKELMRKVAEAQEIFQKRKCGLCGEEHNLRFNVRHVDSFEYFALRCCACNGELAFGQKRDGTGLFPKTWSRYEGQTKGAENAF